jgi:hypothetical protein
VAVKRDKTQNLLDSVFDAVLGMDMSISEDVKIEKRILSTCNIGGLSLYKGRAAKIMDFRNLVQAWETELYDAT